MEQGIVFELQDVSKKYYSAKGRSFYAVDHLSFKLKRSEVCALIGESGSGKTTVGRMLAGLVAPSSGRIFFEGNNLRKISQNKRSHEIQMIFQNPYLSLDPKWRIQEILEEGISGSPSLHRQQKIAEMLAHVLMPVSCLSQYPHELSGGERQRIAIARALLMGSEFLILDEPTSQLDVSTQAEIMVLLKKMKPFLKKGMLFITHDIPLASSIADTFAVMKAGRIVEYGLKKEILLSAKELYTRELLSALPPWPPVFV